MKLLLGLSLAASLVAAPALADCAGIHALDRCLVGTWTYASGGSVTWMGRNIHSAHVTGVSHNGVTITFRADGTFSTGNVDVHTAVAANNGEATGTGHATGSASGNWSAAGGRLNYCATGSTLHQTVTVVVHGRPMTVNVPPQALRPTAMAYACAATELTTTQTMPHLEPIVTVYARGTDRPVSFCYAC